MPLARKWKKPHPFAEQETSFDEPSAGKKRLKKEAIASSDDEEPNDPEEPEEESELSGDDVAAEGAEEVGSDVELMNDSEASDLAQFRQRPVNEPEKLTKKLEEMQKIQFAAMAHAN